MATQSRSGDGRRAHPPAAVNSALLTLAIALLLAAPGAQRRAVGTRAGASTLDATGGGPPPPPRERRTLPNSPPPGERDRRPIRRRSSSRPGVTGARPASLPGQVGTRRANMSAATLQGVPSGQPAPSVCSPFRVIDRDFRRRTTRPPLGLPSPSTLDAASMAARGGLYHARASSERTTGGGSRRPRLIPGPPGSPGEAGGCGGGARACRSLSPASTRLSPPRRPHAFPIPENGLIQSWLDAQPRIGERSA